MMLLQTPMTGAVPATSGDLSFQLWMSFKVSIRRITKKTLDSVTDAPLFSGSDGQNFIVKSVVETHVAYLCRHIDHLRP